MTDVPQTILGQLESCPLPDSKWRHTYELILGAAASLLSAFPHYGGTTHYGHKKQFEAGSVASLLGKAQEAAENGQPLNLYFGELKDWTAGYFFNSAIVRIACGYEYTICTVGNSDPFDAAKFEAVCDSLKQKNPPVKIKRVLEVIKSFRGYGRAEGRRSLNNDVDELADKFNLEGQTTIGTFFQQHADNDDFVRTAILFVWADYNWFKHRPVGYPGTQRARERPIVQYALALRGYCALCDLYSWCRSN